MCYSHSESAVDVISNCDSCACTKTNQSATGSTCWMATCRTGRAGAVSPRTYPRGNVQASVSVSARIFGVESGLVAVEIQRANAQRPPHSIALGKQTSNKSRKRKPHLSIPRHSLWLNMEDSLIMHFDAKLSSHFNAIAPLLSKIESVWLSVVHCIYVSLDDCNETSH